MSRESVATRAPRTATASAAAPPGKPFWSETGWRVLLLAARRESWWLARSPLVLAGLAISGWLIWLNNRILDLPVALYGLPQPVFWWAADVSIAACLLALAGGVLIASQLAASRVRRDAMEQLYASYPASAAVRTSAQLLGVTGPLILAAALTAGAVAWLDHEGTLGAPRLWVLGTGLLLIVLAGAVGVALGSWVQHPLAGILTVLVLGLIEIDLVLSISNPIHLPGGLAWVFPWSAPGSVLNSLPGLSVPYPPPLHAAELAGLIVLAFVAALWPVLARRRVAAALAVAALAVTCWSGWLEARPVSSTVLTAMAREVMQPAAFEQCQQFGRARYCYYPAFAPLVRQWAVPVDGVLARVPGTARRALTVRQVWDLYFFNPPLVSAGGLTSNGPGPPTRLSTAVGNFQQALSADPGLISGSSIPPVYTDASWGTGGSLGAAQFALAVSTAEWATGLPTTGRSVSYNYAIPGGGSQSGTAVLACVPAGQAREAIALWLAAGATPATRSAFPQAGTAGSTQVGKEWVATVAEPGSGPLVGLTVTAQGAALAAEMLRLPDRAVEAVLGARWQYWLSPRATTAELAAALGLRLPPQPGATPDLPYSRGNATYGTYTPPTRVCQ
ncbi:MAG TPA: hypothetical protein VEL03_20880 [Streptosporangiaceae bacterium]|nr:hypothetical protein [Streptosporangiaceae bacterium]